MVAAATLTEMVGALRNRRPPQRTDGPPEAPVLADGVELILTDVPSRGAHRLEHRRQRARRLPRGRRRGGV
eukprot:5483869-Prymnesium_polylepis.1